MKLRAVSLAALAAIFTFAFLFAPDVYSQTMPVSGHTIVLDPGHGGRDPGSAECPGYMESEANLDVALRLRDLLNSSGATVFLTRVTDTYLTNKDRYTYANNVGAEVLVSIHQNGSTDHSIDGTIGLWGKRRKDLDFVKVMHARLAAELGVPDQGVTNFASGVLLKSEMPATIQEGVYISISTNAHI